MVTVIVAVLGILGTLGGVVLGPVVTGRREQQEWVRDRELQVTLDLLEALSILRQRMAQARGSGNLEPLAEALERVEIARVAAVAFAPAQVLAAAEDAREALMAVQLIGEVPEGTIQTQAQVASTAVQQVANVARAYFGKQSF